MLPVKYQSPWQRHKAFKGKKMSGSAYPGSRETSSTWNNKGKKVHVHIGHRAAKKWQTKQNAKSSFAFYYHDKNTCSSFM